MMGAMAESLGANLAAMADTREFEGQFRAWMASEQRRIFLLCRRMLQDGEDADSDFANLDFERERDAG